MSEPHKVAALAAELRSVLNRYRCEMEMTLASVVGTIEVVKLELFEEEKNR